MNNQLKVQIPMQCVSPKQFAEIFWSWDSTQQGQFFDELGTHVMATKCPYTDKIGSMLPLDMQMYSASKECTPLGRDVMSRISENGVNYLKPQHRQ